MEEEQEHEANVRDYRRRDVDPMTRWKWEAETRVTPAEPAKGKHTGIIHFPDGTKTTFVR